MSSMFGKKGLILGGIVLLVGLIAGTWVIFNGARPSNRPLAENTSSPILESPTLENSQTPPLPTDTPISPTFTPTIIPTPIGGSGVIAFCASGKQYRLNLPGEISLLAENCIDGSLSPDGSRLAYHEGTTLFIKNTLSNEISRSVLPQPDSPFDGDAFPRFLWSPDSQRLAFVYRYGKAALTLYFTGPEFDEATAVSQAIMPFSDIGWSADGQSLAFTGATQALEALIYFFDIQKLDLTAINPFPKQRDQIYQLRWSPDGSKLLFANAGVYRNSVPALYVVDVDGSHLTDLAHRASIVGSPWSADGSKIAFCQGEYPDVHEVAMNLDGTGRIDFHERTILYCQAIFSPDGKYVLFHHTEKVNNGYIESLYSLALESQERVKLFSQEYADEELSFSSSPNWSVDGQWIAFASQSEQKIYRIHPDGSELALMTTVDPTDGQIQVQWMKPRE